MPVVGGAWQPAAWAARLKWDREAQPEGGKCLNRAARHVVTVARSKSYCIYHLQLFRLCVQFRPYKGCSIVSLYMVASCIGLVCSYQRSPIDAHLHST